MMRLLVLYHANFTFTPTVCEYLQAIASHSSSTVDYFNVDQTDPVDFAYYDAVFVNFCVTSHARIEEKPDFWPDLVAALARFEGIKVVVAQDEYDFTDRVKEFLLQTGADIVLTNVPPDAVHLVYGDPEFSRVQFETVRTAYLALRAPAVLQVDREITKDELDLLRQRWNEQMNGTSCRDHVAVLPAGITWTPAVGPEILPLAERPIVLGYRGRELPYRLGDLGWHKAEVGWRFKWACRCRDIPCDIEVDEDSRFHGAAWPRFIARCRVMLGTPSGANVFDPDGKLHRRMVLRHRENSKLRYDDVREEVQAHDVGFDMGQVSARIYEAVAAGTALALVRGSYSGVIEPDEHYLPIEPDYSNVDEVLDRILDVPAMQAMADRALAHVSSDPANYYEAMVRRVDELVITTIRTRDAGHARGHGPRHLAVTGQPLGTDPYLIARLSESRLQLKACERSLREFIQAAAENRLEVTESNGTYRVLRSAGGRA